MKELVGETNLIFKSFTPFAKQIAKKKKEKKLTGSLFILLIAIIIITYYYVEYGL